MIDTRGPAFLPLAGTVFTRAPASQGAATGSLAAVKAPLGIHKVLLRKPHQHFFVPYCRALRRPSHGHLLVWHRPTIRFDMAIGMTQFPRQTSLRHNLLDQRFALRKYKSGRPPALWQGHIVLGHCDCDTPRRAETRASPFTQTRTGFHCRPQDLWHRMQALGCCHRWRRLSTSDETPIRLQRTAPSSSASC